MLPGGHRSRLAHPLFLLLEGLITPDSLWPSPRGSACTLKSAADKVIKHHSKTLFVHPRVLAQ